MTTACAMTAATVASTAACASSAPTVVIAARVAPSFAQIMVLAGAAAHHTRMACSGRGSLPWRSVRASGHHGLFLRLDSRTQRPRRWRPHSNPRQHVRAAVFHLRDCVAVAARACNQALEEGADTKRLYDEPAATFAMANVLSPAAAITPGSAHSIRRGQWPRLDLVPAVGGYRYRL